MAGQVPYVSYLRLGDDPHLVASACSDCGALYFDRRNACASCGGAAFGPRRLANDGVLRAFTIVHRATPDVTVPVQPQPLDQMQREILNGSVHLDPHPSQRNTLRTQDIQDPAQAKQFMRTQVSKHLEHFFASDGKRQLASRLSADNQLPSSTISPSRISELENSVKQNRGAARKPKRKHARAK